MGEVYVLRSPSGRAYVGITKHTAVKRWKVHQQELRSGPRSRLHSAMKKYGSESFVLSVLATSDDWTELCALETKFISELGTKYPGGYNLTDGGEGCVGLPEMYSRARGEKISKSLRGKKLSDSHRESLSKAHKGLPGNMVGYEYSIESKAKMSASASLRWKDPDKRAAALATIHSEEAKSKRVASLQGRSFTEEHKKNLRAAQIQRHRKGLRHEGG